MADWLTARRRREFEAELLHPGWVRNPSITVAGLARRIKGGVAHARHWGGLVGRGDFDVRATSGVVPEQAARNEYDQPAA